MQYSISDLERLSGVSVHNIRIWERRYNALTPSRTTGNTRFYDDEQLRRLLGIAALQYAGYRISQVCTLSAQELAGLLDKQPAQAAQARREDYFISELIRLSLIYDEPGISTLLQKCFQQFGLLHTYKTVVYPMLQRVGLLWLNAKVCPSQEHFLSAIIRQKLFAAIDQCALIQYTAAPHWLLFLPEDEDHDIGLLLASYLLRMAGKRVTFLGAKVPLQALTTAVEKTKPDNLLFMMTRGRPVTDAQRYINSLADVLPQQKTYVSGNVKILESVQLPATVQWLRTLVDFEELLAIDNEGHI